MRRLMLPIVIILAFMLAWYAVILIAESKPLTASEVKSIVDAPSKYTYIASGTTKAWYCGKLVSSEIKFFHEKPNKCRIEYLTAPLNGVVIGEDGKTAWRFDPKLQSTVAIECMKPADRLGLFLGNHRIERAGSGQVAGKQADILIVKSKSGEIKKRLWVDRDVHIVLQSEDYDASGKLRASTEFDSIRYVNDLPDSLYEQPANARGGGKTMSLNELSKAVGFRVKLPGYTPNGYKPDAYRLYECPCGCGHKSAYIRYTNGLNGISVFETSKDSSCMMEGECGSYTGTCIIQDSNQGQTAKASYNGTAFTIIADINPRELKRMIDSLK